MYNLQFIEIKSYSPIDTDFINDLTFPHKDEQDLCLKVSGVFKKYALFFSLLNPSLFEIMTDNQIAQLTQFNALFATTHLIDTGSGLAPTVREGSFHIIQLEDQTFYVPLYLLAKLRRESFWIRIWSGL